MENNIIPFKYREDEYVPTTDELALFRVRSVVSEFLSRGPKIVPVALIVRDCFKYMILNRNSDTLLGNQISTLYTTTVEEIRDGKE